MTNPPLIETALQGGPQRQPRRIAPALWIGVAILFTGLAAGIVILALGISSANARTSAAQRGQQTAQQQNQRLQGQLGTMEGQLKAVETKLNAPKAAAQPAILGHLGVCYAVTYDSTGSYVISTSLTSPTDSNGVFSCTTGYFVPVAPTGSGG